MGPARRGVLFILSLLLLVSLIGLAFSVSTNLTLANPSKVESVLAGSNFYTQFADNAISQAKAASNDSIGSERISFDNPIIRQAADAALSPQLVKQQVNGFIQSNYDWLQGKQPKPIAKIDLTSARQDFAAKVGQAVTDRLNALQPCSAAQLEQLQASGSTPDPLTMACLPSGVDPQTEGKMITSEINQSSSFLDNPVITAESLSPDQSKPYYVKLSKAPQAYRIGLKMPYVWAGLIALLVLCMYWAARPKRKGTRRIGVVLAVAGILLLLNKLVADTVFNRLQKQAFNTSSNGQLQQSAIDIAHKIEAQLVRIDMYFGIAFLALGLLLLLLVRVTRRKGAKSPAKPYQPPAPSNQPAPAAPSGRIDNFRAANPKTPPTLDGVTPSQRPSAPASDPNAPQPPRRKPPRLIQ